MGDLFQPDALQERLSGILEWKNLTISGVYQAEGCTMENIMAWLKNTENR